MEPPAQDPKDPRTQGDKETPEPVDGEGRLPEVKDEAASAGAADPATSPQNAEKAEEGEEADDSPVAGDMLGIAPRAEAIVTEHEMSAQEKAILEDLQESMDPEDREHPEAHHPDEPAPGHGSVPTTMGTEAAAAGGVASTPAATTTTATKPKKKPIFPWWFSMLLYGGAGAFAIYTGLKETRQVMMFLFIALGAYLIWGAWEAVRDRNKWMEQPKTDTPPASPPESPPASP